jgi:hypothetical protein
MFWNSLCLPNLLLILILLLNLVDCLPKKSVIEEIKVISICATQTRKSLVKGERFIRSVWMAEMMSVVLTDW